MYEEVHKNIFLIRVPLPNNPLKATNSYFIRGDSHDLLIDTGFMGVPECREALDTAMEELKSDPARRDVLLTHMHADHAGLAGVYCGEDRHIYMNIADIGYMNMYFSGDVDEATLRRYRKEGVPEELNQAVNARFRKGKEKLKLDPRYNGLTHGSVVECGEYSLRLISVPGHCPGNSMFYISNEKIMFTGDHILFNISPNITCFPFIRDSLGNYINSLARSYQYDVKTAFPGHRESGDYSKRISELLHHHRSRLDEVLRIMRDMPGSSAYEIASYMQWRIHAKDWETFPIMQKYFALGECLAHIDYLTNRSQIFCRSEDGKRKYYPA